MSENKHNYKADLLEDLRDLRYAELYLDAAAKESQEAFLLALRDVAEAQKGIAQLAAEANVNRENLYRMLSEEGNPRYSTLESVLNALGMDLTVKLKQPILGSSEPRRTSNTVPSETIAAGSTPAGLISQLKTKTPSNYYDATKTEQEAQVLIRGARAHINVLQAA